MISNFPIIYISKESLYEIFSTNCNRLLRLSVILTLCLLTVTFCSFQNQLLFLRVLLKIHNIFSYNLFQRYKVCLSFMWSKCQIVYIEYPQEICLPIFLVEYFSGSFAQPSVFLTKHSRLACITYAILSDFVYWLNFNIFFFFWRHYGQSLFLHTLSWDISLLSVLKELRQFKQ